MTKGMGRASPAFCLSDFGLSVCPIRRLSGHMLLACTLHLKEQSRLSPWLLLGLGGEGRVPGPIGFIVWNGNMIVRSPALPGLEMIYWLCSFSKLLNFDVSQFAYLYNGAANRALASHWL